MLGIEIKVSMSYEQYSLFGISLDKSQWKCDVTDVVLQSPNFQTFKKHKNLHSGLPGFYSSKGIVGVYKKDKGFPKPI
jgi:hypothetical protein